jgi:hypothetical protein
MKRLGIKLSRLLAATTTLLLICMSSMLSSCGNDDAEPEGINEEDYAFLYDKAFMDSLEITQDTRFYSNKYDREYGKIYYVNKKPVKIRIDKLCEFKMKYIKDRGIAYIITPLAKECDYYAHIVFIGHHSDLLTGIDIY